MSLMYESSYQKTIVWTSACQYKAFTSHREIFHLHQVLLKYELRLIRHIMNPNTKNVISVHSSYILLSPHAGLGYNTYFFTMSDMSEYSIAK